MLRIIEVFSKIARDLEGSFPARNCHIRGLPAPLPAQTKARAVPGQVTWQTLFFAGGTSGQNPNRRAGSSRRRSLCCIACLLTLLHRVFNGRGEKMCLFRKIANRSIAGMISLPFWNFFGLRLYGVCDMRPHPRWTCQATTMSIGSFPRPRLRRGSPRDFRCWLSGACLRFAGQSLLSSGWRLA